MCRLEDILKFLGREYTYRNRKLLNRKDCIMTQAEFKNFKKKKFKNRRKGNDEKEAIHKSIEKNNDSKGIPQGSAMSAVFANIYMLDFDKRINDYVQQYNGLYMRYSDDFIVIFPKIGEGDCVFGQQYMKIQSEVKRIPSLILEPQKTQIYEYDNEIMSNRSMDFVKGAKRGKNSLDYLGFTFDGKQVTLRDKTISKYYYRMYRKVAGVKYWSLKKHRIQTKSLYNLYSEHKNIAQHGSHDEPNSAQKENFIKNKYMHGNFLSYVNRAQKEFGEDEPISRGTKRHMLKIKRAVENIKISLNR
jgi:hypothetical protein